MKVAYVTPFYNGEIDGRYGRFLDWIHWLRDSDSPPFDFDVLPLTVSNNDSTVASSPLGLLGDATALWGSKLNKLEHIVNLPNTFTDIRNGPYDVVHVVVMDPLIFPTTTLATGETPLVIGPDIAGWSPVRTVPYWQETRVDRLENVAKYQLRRLLGITGSYDSAVAFSNHHLSILESFAIPSADIHVLPPSVDGVFSPGPEEIGSPPEILYVGDLSEHKGYPMLLRGLDRLDRDFTVRVVGAGDPNWDRIDKLGLTETVEVEGFVPRRELPAVYRNADVFVMPSIDETAGGNTQIEALASGLPVVVTDQPGVDEYAPPEAKVTIRDRAPDSIAVAIREALEDLEALTAAARSHSSEYTPTETVSTLDQLYRSLA